MTPGQLAHLAGLVDALGRLRVRTTPEGTRLAQLSISSPNMALLHHCAQLTGVKVVVVRRNYQRLGCSDHCDKPHLHVGSVTGRWELVGARAVIVLRALRPHLVLQARDADALLGLCGDAPRKPATVQKMAELGWSA